MKEDTTSNTRQLKKKMNSRKKKCKITRVEMKEYVEHNFRKMMGDYLGKP